MLKFSSSLLFVFTTFLSLPLVAQVIPPGLGKINAATWFALGAKQDLKNSNWESSSYLGFGRSSDPDNFKPVSKPAIFIANQEFINTYKNKWLFSAALSYRRQNEYLKAPPYEATSPHLKQEFRLYGRVTPIFKAGKLKLEPSIRQEFRKFYTPDFKEWKEDLQLRSRFRIKATLPLDAAQRHKLIGTSEQLFSMSKPQDTSNWTDFKYIDSRFALYYAFSLPKSPIIIEVGYMNNLIEQESSHSFALDLIFKNPFSRK